MQRETQAEIDNDAQRLVPLDLVDDHAFQAIKHAELDRLARLVAQLGHDVAGDFGQAHFGEVRRCEPQ